MTSISADVAAKRAGEAEDICALISLAASAATTARQAGAPHRHVGACSAILRMSWSWPYKHKFYHARMESEEASGRDQLVLCGSATVDTTS